MIRSLSVFVPSVSDVNERLLLVGGFNSKPYPPPPWFWAAACLGLPVLGEGYVEELEWGSIYI